MLSPSSERYFRMRPIDLMARVDFLQISLMWLLNDKWINEVSYLECEKWKQMA